MKNWKILRIVFTLIIYFIFSFATAQNIQKVCGEAIYHAPENVTMEQAKQIALQRAKTDAFDCSLWDDSITKQCDYNKE